MPKEVVAPSGSLYNALTTGSRIVGNIVAERDFRIDGEVQGDVQCNGKVVVSQSASVLGKITCVNAEIGGKVTGDITVAETLTLRSTAFIEGDVKTKSLVVEPSAVFNGTCSMKQTQDELAAGR
ncbi:MAG: polymer-forming cytoskeletal protein [Bacteroidales bacterium]|nr:MAG: polymer-forming cytoskeletal protein [Paludibacter sp.]MCE1155594.1 polymer-forming cytoskeletal protein [Bacteroidales bacterium]